MLKEIRENLNELNKRYIQCDVIFMNELHLRRLVDERMTGLKPQETWQDLIGARMFGILIAFNPYTEKIEYGYNLKKEIF